MHAGVFGVGASAAKRFGLVMARARRQEPDKVQALPLARNSAHLAFPKADAGTLFLSNF